MSVIGDKRGKRERNASSEEEMKKIQEKKEKE